MYDNKIIIILTVFAYLFGNISPSVIISGLILKSDIRTHGSGNAGATNITRVMGKRFGALVFILDALKGAIPSLVGFLYGGVEVSYICGIAAVLGHVFPVFLKFKGGKGVATSFGAAIVFSPTFALISISVFILIVLLTKYVSLGSVLGTCTFPILNLVFKKETGITILSFVFALIIIYSHRSNIAKLINGTESKITEKK